ncbi:hypothetical protein D9M68_750620 [compost metagenome]
MDEQRGQQHGGGKFGHRSRHHCQRRKHSVRRRAFAHAGDNARDHPEQDDEQHRPERQNGGVGKPARQYFCDGNPEPQALPEIADERAPEPLEISHESGPQVAIGFQPEHPLLFGGVWAQHLAGNASAIHFEENKNQDGDREHRERHRGQFFRDKLQHEFSPCPLTACHRHCGHPVYSDETIPD